MHPSTLPDDLQAHLIARHGRLHRFAPLPPARCALVVIDMQHIFCAEGALLEVPMARAIVPAINRMARAMRAAGGAVVWVRSAFPPSQRDWHVMFDAVMPPDFGARICDSLQHGRPEHALFDGLTPEPEDIEVEKDRFSAFLPGACPLPDMLRARGIDTVLIAGTMTNVCCESSARDAMMENFRVILLSDANAARSDAEHMGSLITIARSFGDVQQVDEAIGYLS
ncbi:MAG: isochorismatase family protein [Pararhodobacter sp.]